MRHYSAESMPRLWWLSPWSTCREMHGMLKAFQSLAETDGKLNQFHLKKIYELLDQLNEARKDNAELRRRVAELEAGLDRLHTAIITGGAIVPDAKPDDSSHE